MSMENNSTLNVAIIPGNPGIKEYYDDFIEKLKSELKSKHLQSDIVVNCHKGHENSYHEKNYSLSDQINHHIEFVTKFIQQNSKIILIGHSIGSYIILQLLQNDFINRNVIKVFLLFPTFEKLAETPQGKKFSYLMKFRIVKWLLWLLMIIMVNLTTNNMKRTFIQWYLGSGIHPCAIEATSVLLSSAVLQQVIFMAQTEMEQVRQCDWDIIRENHNKIFIYYGRNDHWCPESFYRDIRARFISECLPVDNIFLDKYDIPHAFVLSDSSKMAEILAPFIP